MDDQINLLIDLVEAISDAELDLSEIKAGKRHSGSDQTIVQQIYDTACDLAEMAVALGATEEMDEEYEGGEVEMVEGKAQQTFGGKKREDLDDSDFAGPDRTFPIVTAADVADAASLIGKADNPEAVKRKIIAIAKRKGFPIPDAWKEGETKKAIEDTPLTVSLPTDFLIGDEVKALDGGGIGAYAVRFGSEDEPDMSHMRDYFTKSTDFWLDAWDRRPMLYHHAMDDDTADAPRIGTWTKAEVKDEGVWLEGQLDKGHRYYSAIKELVRRGILRLSSDSAPHLVRREIKEGSHTHEVKRWPLLAASLTPTPMEPRLSAVSFKSLLDELGIDPIVIDDNDLKVDASESDRSDETKALAERSRRLLLELELEQFTLEATI